MCLVELDRLPEFLAKARSAGAASGGANLGAKMIASDEADVMTKVCEDGIQRTASTPEYAEKLIQHVRHHGKYQRWYMLSRRVLF